MNQIKTKIIIKQLAKNNNKKKIKKCNLEINLIMNHIKIAFLLLIKNIIFMITQSWKLCSTIV